MLPRVLHAFAVRDTDCGWVCCVAQVLLSMASQPPGPLCCSLSSEEPSASYMGAQNDQALFMPRVEVPAHHSLALAMV